MKFHILIIGLIISTTSYAQYVKDNITGIEIGLTGINIYNEQKITSKLTLKNEVGLDLNFWFKYRQKAHFSLTPYISVQPTYYYNIDKRFKKGRNTKYNGANSFALQLGYLPNWFVISNYDNKPPHQSIYIIPTFGIKRNFLNNFNYTFNVGYVFSHSLKIHKTYHYIYLNFKIGYDF